MQAAIRLLTLSNLELQGEIATELDSNPLLELADSDGATTIADTDTADTGAADTGASNPDPAADRPAELAQGAGSGEAADLGQQLGDDRGNTGDDLDVDYVEERFHHDSMADSGLPAEPSEGFNFDQLAEELLTLASHLERQAALLDDADFTLVVHLVSLLDDAGYLAEPLDETASRLGVPLAEVERGLALLQGFEPTGVGARNLAECIALQAKDADRYDPCMAALIANLELVARGELAQLRRLCDVDQEDLADMLRELRSYNPKPGLLFGGGRALTVVPDVFVRRSRKDGIDGWIVELNSATLPRLIVNRDYQAQISAHGARQSEGNRKEAGRGEHQFLEQCLTSAQWLIRALDQRATTIMKVATALVTQQQGFFSHGIRHLKPLTLRQIADEIGMHESTVSRVTSNKYLSCDRGLFELKYFFTSAIQGAGGQEDTSAEAVRQRLKALIDAELPMKPLSDDKLVELLKQEGVTLARRTVTKYREGMNIPTSFDRRRRALSQA